MRNFIFIIIIFFISSCSSKRDVLYLQDIETFKSNNSKYTDHIISTDDILKIHIYTLNPEAAIQFNKINNSVVANTMEQIKVSGYLVNNQGEISFPIIGNLKISGLTIDQAQNFIYSLLLEKGYLKNHTVEIRLLNSHFSVIGEVNLPGTYNFLENNINIFEALTMAGDLTINGKRDDIKILREYNNKKNIHSIDLTSSDLINSDYYQIKSGDIIIINPNTTRVKNAGIIGNSGTLLSLLSFITSIIIIISN